MHTRTHTLSFLLSSVGVLFTCMTPFPVTQIWYQTGTMIHDHRTNWNSFLIMLVSFGFLIIVRIANKKLLPKWKYYKKYPIPIPGALIVVSLHSPLWLYHTSYES